MLAHVPVPIPAEEVMLMPRSIRSDDCKPDPKWLMPEALWRQVQPLLPAEKPKGKGTRGGRPHVGPRRTMEAIFYILRTGVQWQALPRSLGAGSTAHEYFQKWSAAGVFEALWRLGLEAYDATKGIQWEWQAMDGVMTKAPLAARRLAKTRRTAAKAAPSARS